MLQGLRERRFDLNREEKAQVITDLKERFQRAKAVVFTDYKGMTVGEISAFRTALRKSSLEYRVVKNTLAKIASQDTTISEASEKFVGPVGIALGYDDPVLVVKKVVDFAKTQEKLKVTAAVVEGKLCEKDEIRLIAELPPRETLLSMMAGVFQAPMSKLASALSATVSTFAYGLEALKNKKEQ